jgi:hypothetical protein
MLLAAVIAGLLARVTAATAAFAQPIPIGNDRTPTVAPGPASTVQVISTGMAGWQITLIAVGGAVAAAAVAVFLDRKLGRRRSAPSATA